MRKHGWELPYHPLQVVAIAVFLALAFAYYVFFVPFVGKKLLQYIAIGLYSLLVAVVFSFYISCAAIDPGDTRVFSSKKYRSLSTPKNSKDPKNPLSIPPSADLINTVTSESGKEKMQSEGQPASETSQDQSDIIMRFRGGFLWTLRPCSWLCRRDSGLQASEDDMLYCSLCEAEVSKYSKHCRVCDKCVDGFDHHCRWLNNCIGRKNYRGFFVLMVSAFLLLILQWVIGIIVLVSCFLNRSHFHLEIAAKLGSSFSFAPFIVVVICCTLLAMVATLPLGQLFFFHILLLRKGISTYDYIIAMREQEQQGLGGQSPQMSTISSATGISSASSFNALQRGAWCTPPRLLFEDQFSVLQPEGATSSFEAGNRSIKGVRSGKQWQRNSGSVKINPWTLARLNGKEVSKMAARARRKSKILQPVSHQDPALIEETDSSFDENADIITGNIPRYHHKKRSFRREKQQSPPKYFTAPRSSRSDKLSMKSTTKIGCNDDSGYGNSDDVCAVADTSGALGPIQIEARNAFCPNAAVHSSSMIVSSPESSLTSPDIQPFRESTLMKQPSTLLGAPLSFTKGVKLRRSTSDGYEASGGESPDDSDRAPESNHKQGWKNNMFLNAYFNEKSLAEDHTALLVSKPNLLLSECHRGETSTQSSRRMGLVRRGGAAEPHSVEEIDFCLSDQDSPERRPMRSSSKSFDQENNF